MRASTACLAAALLLGTLACRPRFIQRARLLKDMEAASEALANQRPLPPLPADPDAYGSYRPVMDHFRSHAERLLTLGEELKGLLAEEGGILKPAALVDPARRQANHARLAKLISLTGEIAHEEDEIAGPAADKAIPALVPDDPEFGKGVLIGLADKRKDLDTVMATLTRKQEYYRRIDHLVGLADTGVIGLSPAGKPLFVTTGQAQEYNRQLQDLLAFERSMNDEIQKTQRIQKQLRENIGS